MIEIGSILFASIYWLPFMIAAGRGHHLLVPIVVANALVGWTGIGWLVVLGWALLSPADEEKTERRPRLHVV